MTVKKMGKDENDKFIYTDSYRTKDIIWEAYSGFIEHYNNHVMMLSMQRIDPITLAGMTRYANYFYEETEWFYGKFEKELGKDQIKEIKQIMDNSPIRKSEYSILRRFFGKFMNISGIKNIIKDVDDAGDSVTQNR